MASGTIVTSALQPVVLEGRHVRLEPLARAHVAALAAAAAGPRDTYRFTYVAASPDEMAAWVETALGEQDARRALPFARPSSISHTHRSWRRLPE